VLRYRYRDDYKGGPKILLWGDNPDMGALSAFFRQFASAPREVKLTEIGCTPVANDIVIVTPQHGSHGGIFRVPGKEHTFRWEIDSTHAEQFAEMVEALAVPSRSGHQYLEHLGDRGPIVVMVSCGENDC